MPRAHLPFIFPVIFAIVLLGSFAMWIIGCTAWNQTYFSQKTWSTYEESTMLLYNFLVAGCVFAFISCICFIVQGVFVLRSASAYGKMANIRNENELV
jgi:hypothetical protein